MAGQGMGGTFSAADIVEILIYATNLKEEDVLQKAAQLHSRVVMLLLAKDYDPVESRNIGATIVSTLKKHTVFTMLSGDTAVPSDIKECLEDDGFTVKYYATQRQRLKRVDEIDIRARHQRVLRHTERKISPNELKEIQL